MTTSSSTTNTNTTTPASDCTPADVHYGLAETTGQRRVQTLAAARAATPHRFSSDVDPKILELPEAAWINPSITQTEDQEQELATAAA